MQRAQLEEILSVRPEAPLAPNHQLRPQIKMARVAILGEKKMVTMTMTVTVTYCGHQSNLLSNESPPVGNVINFHAFSTSLSRMEDAHMEEKCTNMFQS